MNAPLSLPDALPWPPAVLAGTNGHPFDLDAHFPPIPPLDNAAPLYLEALAEFEAGMSVCFPESEREAVERRVVRRHESLLQVFDPATGRALPGASLELLHRVLDSYESGFEKLALAQKRSACAFELGHTSMALVPHLAAARHVVNIARLRNDCDLLQGEFDRPIRTVEMILRLGRDLKPRGSLICQLVAIAVVRHGVELALEIMRRPDVRTAHVDALAAILLDHERSSLPHPLAEGHSIEYVYQRVELLEMEQYEGDLATRLLPFGTEKLTFGEILVRCGQLDFGRGPAGTGGRTAEEINSDLAALSPEDFRREAGYIAEHYSKLIAVSQLPYWEQITTAPEPVGFFLNLPNAVHPPRLAESFARLVSALRMIRCVAATRRWQLEAGGIAPDLELALLAAGESVVPADPFVDGPLRMTLVGGEPAIYSVGPSGTNDGTSVADTIFLHPQLARLVPPPSVTREGPKQYVPFQQPDPARPKSLKGSLRLFRIAGVDVDVHWSWALVAVLQIMNRTSYFSSLWWEALAYVGVFGLVLLHEFGHVFACRQVGGTADRVLLWPLGGLAFSVPPPRPGALLWTITAGPLVNLVFTPILYGLLWIAVPGLDSAPHALDVYRLLYWLFIANLAMLLFNLLPVYPLDGGKILQAVLWWLVGPVRAVIIAAGIGFAAGGVLLVVAAIHEEWWFMVMAVFICVGAAAGLLWARKASPMYQAARRHGFACPDCGTQPPVGGFWNCGNCGSTTDVFSPLQRCSKCASFIVMVPCTHCGRSRARSEWAESTPG